MALIDKTAREYYEGLDGVQQSGVANFGDYQFISLETIINQFLIAYVGEDNIIPKVKRTTVQFHAQRALQELSFDTFKSTKSFEMEVPPSLTLPLPQDYVGYTKLSWVDDSGIKRPIYPTLSKSSNPVAYQQNSDGSFKFETNSYIRKTAGGGNEYVVTKTKVDPLTGELLQKSTTFTTNVIPATNEYEQYGITQSGVQSSKNGPGDVKSDNLLPKFVKETRIDVTNTSGYENKEISYGPGSGMQMNFFTSGHDIEVGMNIFGPGIPPNTTVKTVGDSNSVNYPGMGITMTNPVHEQWLLDGQPGTITDPEATITVDGAISTIYGAPTNNGYPFDTQIAGEEVIFVNLNTQSTAWGRYKSHTSVTATDDYEDDTEWVNEGQRYGIDPQHAQNNGSYYIDDNTGLIHFNSFINGKTIVLDYLSDSLGTDEEMKVHKFAEEAVYKCIAYAIMSTRANVQEYIVRRFQKDKFAAVRKAKLRLSNIKLEELTQILRGKSKHIKH
jgi:hypothetical protein